MYVCMSMYVVFVAQAIGNVFRSIGRWFRTRFRERWFSKKQNQKLKEEMKKQDAKLKAAQKHLMSKHAKDLVDQVLPEQDINYDNYLETVPKENVVAPPPEATEDEGGAASQFIELLDERPPDWQLEVYNDFSRRRRQASGLGVKRHEFWVARMSDL